MRPSGRRKISTPRKIRWGFGGVIFFMMGLSVFLMVSAGSRFSDITWSGLTHRDDNISRDGFIVMDLSDAAGWESQSGSASMWGAAFAAQRTEEKDIAEAAASQKPKEQWPPLPSEIDAFSALPEVENMELGMLSASTSFMTPVKLPALNEPIGDFGPLPKNLADFDSIILNTTDDGMRLPDDSLEALLEIELPDDDIIFADVGVHWKEHVVKSGETLSEIALLYGGITPQDILRANELKDANRLAAQQILLIPNTSGHIDDTLEEVRTRKARVAALREQVEPIKITSYVVVAGDSLWSIANAQNLEVDTLVGSNSFKNSSILHPGVVLRIPNQDGIFYQIKNGDKIENIAKRYQVGLEKIRKANPTVDLVALKAGNEIFLPSARPEAIAEAQPKKSAQGSAGATQNQKSSRVFRWPVMGKINSGFGWRRHPILKRRDFHTGIDIKAPTGTLIRSAGDGRVAYSGWMGGYGKVVVVEHSKGVKTLYAHCSSLLVAQGAKVSSGQNVARVGTTGRTTGAHLHFEVRNGNSPTNPLSYLR